MYLSITIYDDCGMNLGYTLVTFALDILGKSCNNKQIAIQLKITSAQNQLIEDVNSSNKPYLRIKDAKARKIQQRVGLCEKNKEMGAMFVINYTKISTH